MKPLQKMILVTILALCVMIASITFTVVYKTEHLIEGQNSATRKFYMKNKDAELKNYFDLAKQSVEHLLGPDYLDKESQKEAFSILRRLSYGEGEGNGLDGYFFLFTVDGIYLVHGRQPKLEKIGSILAPEILEKGSEREKKMYMQLRKIIDAARNIKDDTDQRGTYVEYEWEKPSKGEEGGFFHKRSYVEVIKGLGILGTGAYLDDIENTLQKLSEEGNKTIRGTMKMILIVSISCIAFMGLAIFGFIRDRSLVDTKLAELYKRNIKIQDQERSRISNQLHDSVKPLIIAARRKTEMSINDLRNLILNVDAIKPEVILHELEDSVSITNQAIEELKREIYKSSSLDIELLDIEGALQSYINKVTSESLPITLNVFGEPKELSYSAKEAFSLVLREAINNALGYSGTTTITVNLNFELNKTVLEIIDNGHGFEESNLNRSQGLGLRNMKERIKVENGEFDIASSVMGTKVTAIIPFR